MDNNDKLSKSVLPSDAKDTSPKNKKPKFVHAKMLILFLVVAVLLLVGVFATGVRSTDESIQEIMRDAVLHESKKVNLFGIKAVNPGLCSAFVLTGIMLVFSLIVRIFVIPKFKYIPGKFQVLLEQIVGLFDSLAKTNSPHLNGFLGAYIFTAGVYIFVGTLFELFGIQVITTDGMSVSLPAPLSDINGAVCMGCLSYLIIMSGGIYQNGLSGIGKTLKDFSLPISMSFRLFGALLSGALVNELVYNFVQLSFVLPVVVGVMFTVLHALIQAYVLTMLTALFYGEVSEKSEKKKKIGGIKNEKK